MNKEHGAVGLGGALRGSVKDKFYQPYCQMGTRGEIHGMDGALGVLREAVGLPSTPLTETKLVHSS
jgi:hypothetical protein